MPAEITMPQLSDTMSEGTVVKWNKKEGDKIKSGDVIAEVETDKATMEMESFESGTLALIVAGEGQKVAVGGAIAVLATGSEKPEDVKKQYKPGSGPNLANSGQAPAATADKEHAAPAGKEAGGEQEYGETARGEHAAPAGGAATATREARAVQAAPTGGNGHGGAAEGRIKVSPLARRIAQDKGIELSQVSGCGPGGRIVQKDILNYKPAPKAAPSAGGEGKKKGPPPISLKPKIPAGQTQSIPHTKMRLVIAQRLQQSKQNIPHFYETIDIDVTDLSRLREQMNRGLEAEGIRLSIGDLIAKGVTHALLMNPALNAHWKDNEVIRHGDVNLGMAVALPDGLIVPVLRGINQLGLREIRQRSAELIDRARKQSLKQNEMTGATFTVSNLGTFGIREFSAIINPPEVGILAIGSAEPRPVVRDGQMTVRTMMTVTLSADHRAVDGATAAAFLQSLKLLLEEPGMMLA
jgi:pyruvate dehydrogenase E2 component (dihydrolipoamide acetyltransferase)